MRLRHIDRFRFTAACRHLAALMLCGNAIVSAQVIRYDMGDGAGDCPEGSTAGKHTQVGEQTQYSTATGYGWVTTGTPTPPQIRVVPSVDPPAQIIYWGGAHFKDIIQDACAASGSLHFRQDLSAGRYVCVLYVGNVNRPLLDVSVDASGTGNPIDLDTPALSRVVEGIDVRVNYKKGNYNPQDFGGFRRVVFTVDVTDLAGGMGQLDVRVSSAYSPTALNYINYDTSAPPDQVWANSGGDNGVAIQGLTIYPVKNLYREGSWEAQGDTSIGYIAQTDTPPVYWDHASAELKLAPWVREPVDMPEGFGVGPLDQAIAAFNDHTENATAHTAVGFETCYQEAWDLACSVNSRRPGVHLGKIWLKAWILGWLTNEHHPVPTDPGHELFGIRKPDVGSTFIDVFRLHRNANPSLPDNTLLFDLQNAARSSASHMIPPEDLNHSYYDSEPTWCEINDPYIAVLRMELEDFRLGELFHRTRAYSNYEDNPDNFVGGPLAGPNLQDAIVLNLAAAVSLLDQIDDVTFDYDYGGTGQLNPRPGAFPSPFYPKARFLSLTNRYSRRAHANVTGPNAYGQNAFRFDYMDGFYKLRWALDPGVTPLAFPHAHEAWVMTHFITTNYVGPLEDLSMGVHQSGDPDPAGLGGLKSWGNDSPYVNDVLPADVWWITESALPTPIGGPGWARTQLEYRQINAAVASWWESNRIDRNVGEIIESIEGGGGDGDDAELLVLSTMDTVCSLAEANESAFALEVAHSILNGPSIDQDVGFWVGPAACSFSDAEHAAELTSFPLVLLDAITPQDPVIIPLSLKIARNMAGLGTPLDGWTSVYTDSTPSTPRDYRLFEAYLFNGRTTPGDDPSCNPDALALVDQHYNQRVALPVKILARRTRMQDAVSMLEEWAWAWWKVSDPAIGSVTDPSTEPLSGSWKPAGLIPAVAQIVSGSGPEIPSGYNWTGSTPTGSSPPAVRPDVTKYPTEIYNLFLEAYRSSTRADRDLLLDPIRNSISWLYDADTAADADLLTGPLFSDLAPRISVAAFAAHEELDQSDRDKADYLVPRYCGSYLAMRSPRVLGPNVPRQKVELRQRFDYAGRFLRFYFPLATTASTYTDRIRIDPVSSFSPQPLYSFQEMWSCFAGTNFSESLDGPLYWSKPAEDGPLPIAVMVTEQWTTDTTLGEERDGFIRALVYNADDEDRVVELQIRGSFLPGRIDLTVGLDDVPLPLQGSPKYDDWIDTPLPPSTELYYSGSALSVTVPLESKKLTVIELFQPYAQYTPPVQAPNYGDLYDLDIHDSDFSFNASSGSYELTVRNIGSGNYPSSCLTDRKARIVSIDAVTGAEILEARETIPSLPGIGFTDPMIASNVVSFVGFQPVPGREYTIDVGSLHVIGSANTCGAESPALDLTRENNSIRWTAP